MQLDQNENSKWDDGCLVSQGHEIRRLSSDPFMVKLEIRGCFSW